MILVLSVYAGMFLVLGIIYIMADTRPPRVRMPNRVRYDSRVKRHNEHERLYW